MDPNELPSVEEGRRMLAQNVEANPEDLTIQEQLEQQRVAQMAAARGSFQSPINVPEEQKQPQDFHLEHINLPQLEHTYNGDPS